MTAASGSADWAEAMAAFDAWAELPEADREPWLAAMARRVRACMRASWS